MQFIAIADDDARLLQTYEYKTVLSWCVLQRHAGARGGCNGAYHSTAHYARRPRRPFAFPRHRHCPTRSEQSCELTHTYTPQSLHTFAWWIYQ